MHKNLVKIGRMVSEIYPRTDRQTGTHTSIQTNSPAHIPGGRVSFSQLQRLSTFSVIWALCIEAFKRESGVRPSVHFLHHSSSSERFGSVRFKPMIKLQYDTDAKCRTGRPVWPTKQKKLTSSISRELSTIKAWLGPNVGRRY